jgi:hypothetical protein
MAAKKTIKKDVPKVIELQTEEDAALSLEAYTSTEEDVTLTESEKKLGPRRLKFVREFIKLGGNAEQAGDICGYSADVSNKIIKEASVKKAITERLQIKGVVQGVDRDWIITKMARIADMCSKEIPEYNRAGQITHTKIVDATNALKALKDIGIEIGMFSDKMNIGGTDKPIQIERKDIVIDIQNIAARLASKMIKKEEDDSKPE